MRLQIYPFDASAQGAIVCDVAINKNQFVDYTIQLSGIDMASATGVGRAKEKLWEKTCFELFISRDERYVEWNVAANGDWMGYAFQSYRRALKTENRIFRPLDFSLKKTAGTIHAHIRLPWLRQYFGQDHTLRINPTFVQSTPSGLQYWAHRHGDQPDFHDSQLFTTYKQD